MPTAQMIAKAWLDEPYRASLAAQGIVVPPRPDLSDSELDTSVPTRERPEAVAMSTCACACGICAC
jgi:hypothetical protein